MQIIKRFLIFIGVYGLITRLYDSIILAISIIKQLIRILGKENKEGIFLFFPFYHTGGAEKVHLDIVLAIKNRKPWIIFTEDSADDCFKFDFEKSAFCIHLRPLLRTESLWGKLFLNVLIWKINHTNNSRVFGANCMFFYSILNQFSSHVTCMDLIHAFVHEGEQGAEYESLPFVNQLKKRFTINGKTKEDFKSLYLKNGLDESLNSRVEVITNTVSVPVDWEDKSNFTEPGILFVSRNSPEKRVDLIGKIARKLNDSKGYKISLVGPGLMDGINEEDKIYCQYIGSISDQNKMAEIYHEAHFLLLCSTREGMPIVIMEAMSNGLVAISTDVGGISLHLRNDENGILVENGSTDKIVNDICASILTLTADRNLYRNLSYNAYTYAREHFSKEVFDRTWNKAFEINK